jgi:hypothetical protein
MRWVSFLLCIWAAQVLAQDYPTRPVRIIVPSPPAGGTDISRGYWRNTSPTPWTGRARGT